MATLLNEEQKKQTRKKVFKQLPVSVATYQEVVSHSNAISKAEG